MKKYKVPYMPERLTSKQKKEYFDRTPVVLKEISALRRETGIVISEESDTVETLRFEAVHGITLPLMEGLLKSFSDIVYGMDDIGFEHHYSTTVGEVMEFMATHAGCTLNAVAKRYCSIDDNNKGYIRDLYITSMVYTGEPTEKFMADFDKLMPLEKNPHRDEFLILANSDAGTDRR